jgi:hypothetical protein
LIAKDHKNNLLSIEKDLRLQTEEPFAGGIFPKAQFNRRAQPFLVETDVM